MPLYEYGCRSCGARFERIRKFEERTAAQACPKCGAEKVEIALSVPAMVGVANGGGGSFSEAPSCSTGSCCSGGFCDA